MDKQAEGSQANVEGAQNFSSKELKDVKPQVKESAFGRLKKFFSRNSGPDYSNSTVDQQMQQNREMQASSDKYWKEKQAQNEARSGSFGATAENNKTVRLTEFDTINEFGTPEGYTPQIAGAQEAVSPLPFETQSTEAPLTTNTEPVKSLLDADAMNNSTEKVATVTIPTPESRAQVSEPILKPDDTGFVEAKTEPAAEIAQPVTQTQEKSYADMVNGVVDMPQAGSEFKAETPENVTPFPSQPRDTNSAA